MASLLEWLSRQPLFFPPDVFERHYLASQCIDTSDSVLDVGGELGNLKKFTMAQVTVVDIGKGDIQYDGKHLPVADRSYDVVTAIDVLEHVPKKARADFIRELIRVAKKRIILSFPLGTSEHEQAERTLLADVRKKGNTIQYLEEHVAHGLPTVQEVVNQLPWAPSKTQYIGDWRRSQWLLVLHASDPPIPIVCTLWFFLKLVLYGLLNSNFLVWHSTKEHPYTNRVYVVVDTA